MKNISLRNLNYIQIIFHLLATYFILFSFRFFSWLPFAKLIELGETIGPKKLMEDLEKYGLNTVDVAYFNFWTQVSCVLGIICAFVISVIISKIKNWSVLNSLIVLIISYLLFRFDFLGWNYLRRFLSLGQFANNYRLNFIITGSVLMIISFIIFFSKWTNRLIENQYDNKAH